MKGTMKPGTVCLQYVDDDTCFVGVVVGSHMAHKLDTGDRDFYEKRDDKTYNLYLLLGRFENPKPDFNDMFSQRLPEKFPTYMIGEDRVATPTDLLEEIALFINQCKEPVSRGLNFGKLKKRIFSFNSHQLKVLELIYFIRHYLSGGNSDDCEEIFYFSKGNRQNFFSELEIAIPR